MREVVESFVVKQKDQVKELECLKLYLLFVFNHGIKRNKKATSVEIAFKVF
ncbi:hypothetical protein T190130A13A_20487 [Tenacibaculum sp. 190130A14a]|uniref:Uncharacterized protein n=1 Tax=Tenacibaculum polynesiense TaxID=3137857 RepID=A0ABM9PBE9_9FLAO